MIGQGKVSGKAIVDLDVVRQKQSSGGWFDPTSYLTGKLPVTASGRIVTWDGKGKFELETRRSERRADSEIVPRADGEFLHAHRRQSERLVDRRHLRAARQHPTHRRRRQPLDRPSIADGRRGPADALAVPEGRRSAQGRGSQEGRPQHRRRPAVSFPSPLRGSQPHAEDHLAAAGHDGGDLRHRAECRARAHAPARLSPVLGAGAGRERTDPGGVAEPGVPQGRHQVAAAHRPLRQGRDLGIAGPADHRS